MATQMTVTREHGRDNVYQRATATGSGAIDHQYTVIADGRPVRLSQISLSFSSTPTTSEMMNICCTQGGLTNCIYYRDLADENISSVIISPGSGDFVILSPSSIVSVVYANSDANTWRVCITATEA